MANIMFSKGFVANLPQTSEEGRLYFTLDESIYLGLSNGSFHRYGDFIEVDNVTSLPTDGAHVKALYYCKAENVLAKWDGSAWVQINKDTDTTYTISAGATAGSIKLTGKDKSGKQVSVEEVQIVDVAAIEASIKEAKDAADAAQGDVDALEERVTDVEEAIELLNGDAEGSVNAKVKAAVEALDVEDAEVEGQFVVAVSETDGKVVPVRRALKASDIPEIGQDKVTGLEDALAKAEKAGTDAQAYAEGVNTAFGEYKTSNDQAVGETLAEAQAKVASVTAGDASVTVGGTSTAPTIAVKVSADADNAITVEDDGLKVVIPSAAEYSIVKDENSGDFAAVYHLTKDGVNVGTAINIPKDMVVESGAVVENPEGQPEGTYIKLVLQNVAEPLFVNVGSLIEYVTSGSTADDMVVINVSEDHKVTATMTDGSITLAKLSTEVQTAIGKSHSHENAAVLDGITADKVNAWDSAEADAIAEATRLDGVLKGELQTEIGNVDAKFADYSTTTQMNEAIKAETDRAKEAETDLDEAKADKATTLAGYGITDAMTATEIAEAIKVEADRADDAEKVLSGRLDTLEAIDHDAYIGADETNLQAAKDYADEKLAESFTWGEF